jgi:N-acetylmuramoyl-L-alanine amidase
MKYIVDAGHGCKYDGGARGIRLEEDFINQTCDLLIPRLRKMGHDVVTVRPTTATSTRNSLQQRCDFANKYGGDLYISIHYNSFSNPTANGTEVFAISEIGKRYAQNVVNNISALGFKNRGVQDGSRIYVLRNTNMPAILIEGCFISNKLDCDRFDAEEIVSAIIKGITCI